MVDDRVVIGLALHLVDRSDVMAERAIGAKAGGNGEAVNPFAVREAARSEFGGGIQPGDDGLRGVGGDASLSVDDGRKREHQRCEHSAGKGRPGLGGDSHIVFSSAGGSTDLRKLKAVTGKARSRNKTAWRTLAVRESLVLIRGMEAGVHLSMEESAGWRTVSSGNYVENPDHGCCSALLALCFLSGSAGAAPKHAPDPAFKSLEWAVAEAVCAARADRGGELLGDLVRSVPGGAAAAGETGRGYAGKPVRFVLISIDEPKNRAKIPAVLDRLHVSLETLGRCRHRHHGPFRSGQHRSRDAPFSTIRAKWWRASWARRAKRTCAAQWIGCWRGDPGLRRRR